MGRRGRKKEKNKRSAGVSRSFVCYELIAKPVERYECTLECLAGQRPSLLVGGIIVRSWMMRTRRILATIELPGHSGFETAGGGLGEQIRSD